MNYRTWLLAAGALLLAACGAQEQAAVPNQSGTGSAAPGQVQPVIADAAAEAEPADPAGAEATTEVATVAETAADDGAEMAAAAGETIVADAGASLATAAAAAGAALAEPLPAVASTPQKAAEFGAAAGPDLELGERIYTSSCAACHGSGVAGAPKLGDAENWAPRIAQGLEVMTAHAINGFQGTRGYMPPRGGYASLTDAEMAAAVAYMAEAGR